MRHGASLFCLCRLTMSKVLLSLQAQHAPICHLLLARFRSGRYVINNVRTNALVLLDEL